MKPILVSSGEPAGIGPDVCLAMAKHHLPIVVLADKTMLAERRDALGIDVCLRDYDKEVVVDFTTSSSNTLYIKSLPLHAPVTPGVLDVKNAPYVQALLETAAQSCEQGDFSALVTAPVHKGVINQAGIAFTGHTEFFADYFGIDTVVMMLASNKMRVALMTTHLPLHQVASSITAPLIIAVIQQLHQALTTDLGISAPKILVAGLNPHAGEGGYLGREEIEVITPALAQLQKQGIDVQGPYPADTLFCAENAKNTDVFLAMYHDQGLPVLKYASFGQAVNITLGLPIIRTSVDHGTGCDIAASGTADAGSLFAAIQTAREMAQRRSLWQKSV